LPSTAFQSSTEQAGVLFPGDLRRMIADAAAGAYESFPSLAVARHARDAFGILEGDDGGQIYVVAPVERVACSQPTVNSLLQHIDAREWKAPEAARLFFEGHRPGDGVPGGMGGGIADPNVWTHPRLSVPRAAILAVLAGESATILDPAV
jgi:hypothetical protein